MIIFIVGDAFSEALCWNNFIEVLFKLQIVILALFLFAPVVVSILFGI